MDDERDEIINAIQNGFFNEGIYRIGDDETKVPEEIKVPVHKTESVKEKEYPQAEVISVAEVSEKEAPPIQKVEEPEVITNKIIIPEFFGGNKKGVCILVNYRDERWIYFKDKLILEKILESVKLKFEDVALINTYYYKPPTIEELADQLLISKVIGFDINDPFMKGFKRDEPQKTSNSSVFLMNSGLNEIAMDVAQKRLLWNNLKLMFNIG
jgi:hypothetical protein